MPQDEPRWKTPGDLRKAVTDAVTSGRLAAKSAFRLFFAIEKGHDKGYVWWKRTSWADHWHVHKTTITLDYARWTGLGFVKLRANPFKASAKLLIFPWSKVWADAVWEDPEKVASMLPDLRVAFPQKSRKGRMHATQKGCTDASFSTAPPLSENLKSEKQAAGCVQSKFSDPEDPRNPATDSGSEGSSPPRGNEHRDNDTPQGFPEMLALLARYPLRAQPVQVQALVDAGLGAGFSVDGVLAFVEDKLKEKIQQNDPVYSVKFLINAIQDPVDQNRFVGRGRRCSQYFQQQRTNASPFTVEELRDHLSEGAERLRAAPGFDNIASEVTLIARNAETHFRDLQALDECLVRCEDDVVTRARSLQTEEDVIEMRREIDAALKPYRGKLTPEQLTSLEHQYFGRRMFERFNLSRLSLFYLASSRAAA